MTKIGERVYSLITYGIAGVGVAVNWENVKSIILFIGAIILLGLQIRLHVIKIKKENNNKL